MVITQLLNNSFCIDYEQGNLGQVVHTTVTKQYNLVLAKGRWCSAAAGWKGNRRPGKR